MSRLDRAVGLARYGRYLVGQAQQAAAAADTPTSAPRALGSMACEMLEIALRVGFGVGASPTGRPGRTGRAYTGGWAVRP